MRGLPDIDARYWLLLLTASVCGTNLGDFASETLRLGFFGAFVPFTLLFLAMVFAAGRIRFMSEAYYWLAILISRASATDIADLATHQLRLSYPMLLVAALAALALALAIGARLGQSTIATAPGADGRLVSRPAANATYWVAMIMASAFGTMAGDFLADELGFGFARAALGSVALAGFAVTETLSRGKISKLGYWGVVLAVRVAATNFGDFAAGDGGLGLGFVISSLASFTLLALFTLTWRPQRLAQAS